MTLCPRRCGNGSAGRYRIGRFAASLDTLRTMGVRVLFDPAAIMAEVAAALPAVAT
jgi:hypothetical protein